MSSVAGDITTSPRMHRSTKAGSVASAPAADRGHTGSPSIISSTDTDEAGARLSALALSDSPPENGRASPQLQRRHDYLQASQADPFTFQVGNKPSGDVFLSPVKDSYIKERSVTSPYAGRGFAGDNNGDTIGPVTPTHTLRHRSSNLTGRHFVGGVDAQGIYPPSACVFVANLPEPKDDRALEAAVTREFSKYGIVFVKIRRDTHHMPFAFCQYTKDEDARDAMVHGKGAMILGRACRTEMVKANRTFIVYKRLGGDITVEEARDLLQQYGPINKAEHLHAQLRDMLGLPSTVVVEFSLYDPGRDLHSAFRYHEDYRVELFDLKKGASSSRTNADENYLTQYEVDRRSVFVGGIGSHVTEEELRALFSDIGEVVNVQLIKKQGNGSMHPRVFGFVEFERPDHADHAVQKLHEAFYDGAKLRVERKVHKEPTPRRVRSQFLVKSNTNGGSIGGHPSTPEALNVGGNYHRQQPGADAATPIVNSAPPPWGWMYGAQPFNSPAYMAQASPPYSNQANASHISITPQVAPGSMAPYGYYGNYWPGVPMMQDPMVHGMPYYGYNSPTAFEAAPPTGEEGPVTPTRVPHSNTLRLQENLPSAEKA